MTFQFQACTDLCKSSIDAFLTHFTSPANTLPATPTRSSHASFTSFFTTSPWQLHSSPLFDNQSPYLADARATIELVIKQALSNALHAQQQNSSADFTCSTSPVSLLFDLSLYLKSANLVDGICHLGLLEDCFESSTIQRCETLFHQVLKPRIDLVIRATDSQRARLVFFRLCNSLLRRLSKTTNTFFAGQISMQISYICPVDERSAVNLLGRFNKENTTLADDEPALEVEEGEADEEEEAAGEAKKSTDDAEGADGKATNKPPSFYRLLWNLQHFFPDPFLVKDASELQSFERSCDAVLSKFESIALVEKEAISAFVSSNGRGVGGESAIPSVFPKYLTGGRLLELQLKDAMFRREILLQILLYTGHLLNPAGNYEVMKEMLTHTSTSSAATVPPTPTSASAQLAQTQLSGAFLPVTALPQLRAIFSRTLRLFRLTPPFSLKFAEAFLALFAREHKFWLAWKEAKCPPIERASGSMAELEGKIDVEAVAKQVRDKRAGVAPNEEKAAAPTKPSAKSGFGRPRVASDPDAGLKSASGRLLMGSRNLAKLWDPQQDSNQQPMQFLKSEERVYLPDLQHKFISTLVDEEEEWRKQNEWESARKAKAEAREKAKSEGDVSMSVEDDDSSEYPGFGVEWDEMLKNDPRKPWQFLRLCVVTPQVQPTWLQTEEVTAAIEHAGVKSETITDDSPIAGLEMFMRSEGSLGKLVTDVWQLDRKRKIALATGASLPPNEEEAELEQKEVPAVSPVDVKRESTSSPSANDITQTPVESPAPAESPAESPTATASSSESITASSEVVVNSVTSSTPTDDADDAEERPKKRVKLDRPPSTSQAETPNMDQTE